MNSGNAGDSCRNWHRLYVRKRVRSARPPFPVDRRHSERYAEQMKRMALPAVLALPLLLNACGEHLGEYQFEDVQLVQSLPPAAVDGKSTQPGWEYLRVELSSRTSLYAAQTGPGLYADADFCPLRDQNRLIAFGPVATDGNAVEEWKRMGALTPDPRDNRYHYFVYLVPSSPPRKLFANSGHAIPAYDVRGQKQDVCFRFHIPGYNIIPSRSDVVQIPAERLASAFKPA